MEKKNAQLKTILGLIVVIGVFVLFYYMTDIVQNGSLKKTSGVGSPLPEPEETPERLKGQVREDKGVLSCGNDVCEFGESQWDCCLDCPCDSGLLCNTTIRICE